MTTDFVNVYAPISMADLLCAKSALIGAGIDFVVTNEFGLAFTDGVAGSVEVLVRAEDLEPAVVALAELLSDGLG